MSTCPDDAILLQAGTEVRRHLDSCEPCRQRSASLAAAALSTTWSSSEPGARALAAADVPGTKMGRYVLLRRIGAGGMGVVFAAYDPQLDRKIALKLVRREKLPSGAEGEAQARLQREAQALARLSHPNVVTVFDVGDVDGQLFIAMEFVDGATLGEWCREPRSWRETLSIFLRAGEGLAAAHRAGLVHRDFKPDNVLMGKDGSVRVTDFGLAKRPKPVQRPSEGPGQAEAPVEITSAGAVVGTPAYMAPEQLEGRAADARSDQFSFCVSLFEALLGERPFAGSTVETLKQEIKAQRLRAGVAGRRIPRRLVRVIARGLSHDPAQRHESMSALLTELRRDPAARWRQRLLLAGAATVVVVALGLPTVRDWMERIPPPRELPARMTASQLEQAFTASMQQSFVEGKVQSIDCSEHPCLVFGWTKPGEDLEAIKQAPAAAPYAADEWTWQIRDRREGQYFSVALLVSEDLPRVDQVMRRVKVRWLKGAQANGWPE